MLSSCAKNLARGRFWLLALLSLSLAGGDRGAIRDGGEPAREELPPAERLRDGDIVFRRGRSILSSVVLSTDAATAFSHVGIVHRNGGRLEVVHAVPGEGDRSGGGVVAETYEEFFAPAVAERFAIYRPRVAGIGTVAAEEAVRLLRRPFDDRFDLATESHLYCTELVWRAYLRGGLDLVDGDFDWLDFPIHRGPVLLLSRLQESRHLVRIALEPKGDRHAHSE